MSDPYREHRATFARHLRDAGAAAIVPTATQKTRNADAQYRFRPDSDFWYLTGFAEPDAVLVMLPAPAEPGAADRPAGRSVLFLRPRDPEREVWNGRRLGLEAAPAALGVDEAHPIETLWQKLPELLAGQERIVARLGREPEFDRRLAELLETLRGRVRGGLRAPFELVDYAQHLHEQRLVKTPAELARMRRAAEVSAEAHGAAMAAARPGLGEHEIEALIEYHFRRAGSTGPAYTSIVAGGENACILHYVENNRPLADGDLLLIDAGAEWDYYASDVTRTFPVNGRFTPDQRGLYQVVLDAQLAAIAAVRPGATLNSIHQCALEHLVDGLVRLGLLAGERAAILEDGCFRRFYMHRTSHWLGLDVHDCGAYAIGGAPRPLEPGMVLTVEPGLYVAADDETVDARWRGLGVRIEDDVLVTERGCEVLTAAIPKTIAEVEAACSADASLAGVP